MPKDAETMGARRRALRATEAGIPERICQRISASRLNVIRSLNNDTWEFIHP
jgi:hypothetical protein